MSKLSATGRNLVIFILCIFVALAAYKYTMSPSEPSGEEQAAAVEEQGASTQEDVKETEPAAGPETETAQADIKVDVARALARRAMGDPEAPVTIYEYSSLTCPHCASFHAEVLPVIKEKYIDTGKVYWVANDFPLDRNAMQAAVMARCAPVDNYFAVVEELFAGQKEWGMSNNVPVALARIGEDHGLEPAYLEACLNNEALSEELYKRMKKAGQKHEIRATPSFVLNDGADVISGGLPYDKFARRIDALLTD